MTKHKQPIDCDLCGKEITSEKKYSFQVTNIDWSAGTKEQGSSMDCCHKCFLNCCSNGYVPKWKYYTKDPQSTKENDIPYWKPLATVEPQEKLAEGGLPVGAIPK